MLTIWHTTPLQSERMTLSLKRFRMQTFRDKMADEGSDASDPEDNRSSSIKRRHQRELEQAERENRENTSALLELRDMDDELNTMRNLFNEQQATIETMRLRYEAPELLDLTENGRRCLTEALERLEEYKKQTGEMIDRVDTTRKDVRTPSVSSFPPFPLPLIFLISYPPTNPRNFHNTHTYYFLTLLSHMMRVHANKRPHPHTRGARTHSTRSSWRWCSGRRRWTRCGGRGCRRSWRARRTCL